MASSEEWVSTVDRGGLIHVTDSFWQTLCAVEYSIRQSNTAVFDKTKLHKNILDNSEVLFNWCCASAMVDDDEKMAVLNLVITTIRGFSFAKSVLETFTKKSTSKAKPLRKKISD